MHHHATLERPCATAVVAHDESAHRRAANGALAVSAVGLGVAGSLELGLALLTGSVGLLGDAIHNLSDVSTSLVVFFGFWLSKRAPSARYPTGYERAEDLAGLGVAAVIWASAVFAGLESYRKLVGQGTTTHLGWGMAAATIGILANQLVAGYKRRVGRRIQSATLLADAHHSRLDAASSLGALVGVVGVWLGYRWADPVAGFAVTLFIVRVGWEVTSALLRRLMDGVDPHEMEVASGAARAVPGVVGAHARGRWTGRTLRIDVDAYLDEHDTTREATRIARAIEAAVYDAVPRARQVRVLFSTLPDRA
jgi:cation diffusion facilitator family transporter